MGTANSMTSWLNLGHAGVFLGRASIFLSRHSKLYTETLEDPQHLN